MIEIKELCQFLVEAKKATYAAGDAAREIQEKDKSKTLIFQFGDWLYHDNFFGGEPFGGREVVFYKNKPIYLMAYYGMVNEGYDFNSVYEVLRGALKLISEDKPFRGPGKYKQAGFEYSNSYHGSVINFSGEEIIKADDGKEIYKAKYIGGLIDQKRN